MAKKTQPKKVEEVASQEGQVEVDSGAGEIAGADLSSPELAGPGTQPQEKQAAVEEIPPGYQKLKILKAVGHYELGSEVVVEDKLAEQLCMITEVHDGEKLVKTRKAMPLAEYIVLEKEARKVENLTAAEGAALGIKNIVPTPKDPVFEARLEAIKKGEVKAE